MRLVIETCRAEFFWVVTYNHQRMGWTLGKMTLYGVYDFFLN